MRKVVKISIILVIIGTITIIPIAFLLLNRDNQSNDLLLVALNLRAPETNEKIPDWPMLVNGSAVTVPINMSYTDFVTESNFSGNIVIQGKIGGKTFVTNYYYEGIPFRRLIHDIMNVSSYSYVKVLASDYYKTFQQADIEDPLYVDDFYLMYKMEGQNLTNYYKPVYCVITQDFTGGKYSDSWNGQWCVRHVVAFEINL